MSQKKWGQSEAVIVLAMHGAPPLDFPQAELAEFLGLRARLGRGEGGVPDGANARFREQERHPASKFIYAWPFATEDIARFLAAQTARFL